MNSFVINKNLMGDEEIKDFLEMKDRMVIYDTVGETENFFFGVLDESLEFYAWIKNKHFIKVRLT
jgi:hypothetical protein